MTLNASGPISLGGSTTGQSIALEIGQSATGQISLNDANVRTLAGVSSGAITIPTNFYGKSYNPYSAGLIRSRYNGYFNDDVNWFGSQTPVTTDINTSPVTANYSGELYSFQWYGLWKANSTEVYTFYTTSDDASYLWVGPTAVSGFTTSNAVVQNGGLHGMQERSGTISLTAGTYYNIRIQFGQNYGGEGFIFNFSTPSISQTTNVTGYIFYS